MQKLQLLSGLEPASCYTLVVGLGFPGIDKQSRFADKEHSLLKNNFQGHACNHQSAKGKLTSAGKCLKCLKKELHW